MRVVSNDSKVFLAHPSERGFLYLYNEIESEQTLKHVTLCTALIKQDKFEWMLQKACELGVTRIVPFTCRNTIIHLDSTKEKRN